MVHKFIFIIIFVIGLFLRILGLSNPAGLSYDELFSLNIANIEPFANFIGQLIATDYHPPLYYIVLKYWVKITGMHDASIHFLSVIFSSLCIWIAYIIGKACHSKNLGLLLCAFFALNFCFINKCHDARFYQMSFLEMLLIILFSIKFIKKLDIKYFNYALISGLFLLYTLTSGTIFVAINFIVLIFLVNKINKQGLKSYIKACSIAILFYLPQACITFLQIYNSKNTLLQNPWEWIYDAPIAKYLYELLTALILPIPKLEFGDIISFIFIGITIIILFLVFFKTKDTVFRYLFAFFITLLMIYHMLMHFGLINFY